jgi:hypothetical protein
MKIKRFEDIEAWQLAREKITSKKNREPETVNQIT